MTFGGYGYNTTCLCFDLEIEDERICYEIFKKIGRKWKSFLLTVLMLQFPDYYENHIITENLEFFINKYSKDFDKKKSPNPIFIGWHSLEYDADQLTDVLLNEHLRGGAKDFIVMLLKESLPFMFNTSQSYAGENEQPSKKT